MKLVDLLGRLAIAVGLLGIVAVRYVRAFIADLYCREEYRGLATKCDYAMHDEAAIRRRCVSSPLGNVDSPQDLLLDPLRGKSEEVSTNLNAVWRAVTHARTSNDLDRARPGTVVAFWNVGFLERLAHWLRRRQ